MKAVSIPEHAEQLPVVGLEEFDYLLFDTAGKGHGGTGRKFDWSLFERYTGGQPYFLAGGSGRMMPKNCSDGGNRTCLLRM